MYELASWTWISGIINVDQVETATLNNSVLHHLPLTLWTGRNLTNPLEMTKATLPLHHQPLEQFAWIKIQENLSRSLLIPNVL